MPVMSHLGTTIHNAQCVLRVSGNGKYIVFIHEHVVPRLDDSTSNLDNIPEIFKRSRGELR